MEEATLKPCPFCGGVARINPSYDGGALVFCTQCHCEGEFMKDRNSDYPGHAKEQAIEAWNTRYTDDTDTDKD